MCVYIYIYIYSTRLRPIPPGLGSWTWNLRMWSKEYNEHNPTPQHFTPAALHFTPQLKNATAPHLTTPHPTASTSRIFFIVLQARSTTFHLTAHHPTILHLTAKNTTVQ